MGIQCQQSKNTKKKWVFITTDFTTTKMGARTDVSMGVMVVGHPDSTIVKRMDFTMNRNKTDFIMRDSIMKKNLDFIMKISRSQMDFTMTDSTTTDFTTTISKRRIMDSTMIPKRDFTITNKFQ